MSGDHNQSDSGWRKRQIALDKKAENARELGLDYEPDNMIHTDEDDEFERIEREIKWRNFLAENPPVAIPLITEEEWQQLIKENP